MKNRRQEAILEIISDTVVDTQKSLIKLLEKRGIKTTQATLSRDIQQLSLVKARDKNGVNRYMLPASNDDGNNIFSEAVLSVDHAMNTIVLKCKAGMAQGACAAIDLFDYPGIVGTIAGDDTIFILARTEADAERLSGKFRKRLSSHHKE